MAQTYMTETGNDRSGPEHSGSRFRRLLDSWRHDSGIWRRGLVLAAFSVLLALVMLLHAHIPNRIGNIGSLIETFLPWLGIFVPLVLIFAVVRKSATALIAVLLPAVVWVSLFGGLISDKSGAGGDLTVVTHNVNAENPDPTGTARKVAASGADVVALEELTGDALPTYKKAMAETYKYSYTDGTVGLWSKYPLTDNRPVDIKMGWTRALRSTVDTPKGKIAVYVAHLPSVRSSSTRASPQASATTAPRPSASPSATSRSRRSSCSATSTAP